MQRLRILIVLMFCSKIILGQGFVVNENCKLLNGANIISSLPTSNKGELKNANQLKLSSDLENSGMFQSDGRIFLFGKVRQHLAGSFSESSFIDRLIIQKQARTKLQLDNEMPISKYLVIDSGIIVGSKIIVLNSSNEAVKSIAKAGDTDAYIAAQLEWNTKGIEQYNFPIGDSNYGARPFLIQFGESEKQRMLAVHFQYSLQETDEVLGLCGVNYNTRIGEWRTSLTGKKNNFQSVELKTPAIPATFKAIVAERSLYENSCSGFQHDYILNEKALSSEYAILIGSEEIVSPKHNIKRRFITPVFSIRPTKISSGNKYH